MGKFVRPRAFRVGYTQVDTQGLTAYLEYTKQTDFLDSLIKAEEAGVSPAECLISFYAKLCYKSLTMGNNSNLTRVRDIPDNILGIIDTAHGSVFEHVGVNFVVTDCSRIYTHEQVRHRQGTAYSQTSGRFCRLDQLDLVFDPILEPARELWEKHLVATEDLIYLTECKLGLRKPPGGLLAAEIPPELTVRKLQAGCEPEADELDFPAHLLDLGGCSGVADRMTPEMRTLYDRIEKLSTEDDWATIGPDHPKSLDAETKAALRWVPDNDTHDFPKRKAMTSAIRRIAPNGQANEIGMTLNIRALRHTILIRTQRFAEWEIRVVYAEIYELVKEKFPLLFSDAKVRIVEGLPEIYGMKMQPYDIKADDPAALKLFTDGQLIDEFRARKLTA